MSNTHVKKPGASRASSEQTSNACMHFTITQQKREVSATPVTSIASILDEVDRRHAEKRRALISNLFDFSHAGDPERQAQADGAVLCDNSKTASLVDLFCAAFRCTLVGLAPDDEAVTVDDEEIVWRDDALVWLFQGDDDFIVHLKTSSPQKLAVIADGAELVLSRMRDLCDALGDRVEALRTAGVEVSK